MRRATGESFAALGDTPMPLYLEDLTPGLVVTAGPVTVTEADAIRFAKEFDPQYFHTDPVAAKNSMFEGLAVSGWHTAALSMRMLTQSSMAAIANGLVGIEVRTMHWPRTTRPGDTLRLTVEVLETKPSRSRPGWGTALLRWITRNQNDEIVMKLENVAWVACRPAIER
jgi:acyl dehydratase